MFHFGETSEFKHYISLRKLLCSLGNKDNRAEPRTSFSLEIMEQKTV